MDLSTVQKRISLLEKYSQENRELKEMIKEELENEIKYVEAVEETKAAVNKRKQIKDEILANGPNQKMLETIKSNSEEIATLREILSSELMQVYEENKTDEIADENGENRKFKINVKLLPKGVKLDKRDNLGQYTRDE